jgi:hypothetical protein
LLIFMKAALGEITGQNVLRSLDKLFLPMGFTLGINDCGPGGGLSELCHRSLGTLALLGV